MDLNSTRIRNIVIEPINGQDMWMPSDVPTTLLPPKHHKQIGRPKKVRRKSAHELEDIKATGKLSKAGGSVTCSRCGHVGHNKARCLGQGGETSGANGDATGGKTVGVVAAKGKVKKGGAGGANVAAKGKVKKGGAGGANVGAKGKVKKGGAGGAKVGAKRAGSSGANVSSKRSKSGAKVTSSGNEGPTAGT